MAGSLTYVGAADGVDAATGRATVTAATHYVALLTAAPTAATTLANMVEYSATGYSRQAATFTAPAGTPRVSSNTAAISFGPLTGANGSTQIVGWLLVDAQTGTSGKASAFGTIDVGGTPTPRVPAAGDSVSFAAGTLSVQIA